MKSKKSIILSINLTVLFLMTLSCILIFQMVVSNENKKSIKNIQKFEWYINKHLFSTNKDSLKNLKIISNKDFILVKNNDELIKNINKKNLTDYSNKFLNTKNILIKDYNNKTLIPSIKNNQLNTQGKIKILNNNFIIKYQNNNLNEIINKLLFIFIAIFIIGFIVTYHLAKKITKPISEANQYLNRLVEKSSYFKNNLYKHKKLFSHDHNIYNLSDTNNSIIENIEKETIENYMEELENYYENSAKFISKLSHDLRTPLTLIKGYSQGIKVEKNSKNQRYLNNIVNSVKDIENIIYNELDLSFDINSEYYLHKIKINLKDFIEEVIDDIKEISITSNRKIQIENNFTKGFSLLDKSSIKRVIDNVINNGLKYSSKPLKINFYHNKNNLAISIKDQGIGMSPSDLNNIEKMFYQGKNNKSEGYGLGLYISHCILEAHNFNYAITSEINKGTEFIIYINILNKNNGIDL